MKRMTLYLLSIAVFVSLLAPVIVNAQQSSAWQNVQNALSATGKVEDGLLKVSIPRSDLTVKKNDIQLAPQLGLSSVIDFAGTEEQAWMTADLVLQETEVQQVFSAVLEKGITVTALHNHLTGTSPSVMYLHLEGFGNAVNIATALRSALSQTATPFGAPEATPPSEVPAEWNAIQGTIGGKAEQKGSVLEVTVQRKDTVTENGSTIPPALGVESVMAFQKAGGNTASTGEFVLVPEEVNRVAKVLKSSGIEVTAIHNHLLFENPRLIYLHYWALGDAATIANTIKTALQQTNSAP